MPYLDPSSGKTLYTTEEASAAVAKPGTDEAAQAIRAAYALQTPEQTAYVAQQVEASRIAALTPEQRQAEELLPQIQALRSSPALHGETTWQKYVDLVSRYDALVAGDQSYLITQAVQGSGVTRADVVRAATGGSATKTEREMVSAAGYSPTNMPSGGKLVSSMIDTEAIQRGISDQTSLSQTQLGFGGPGFQHTEAYIAANLPIGTVSEKSGTTWTGTGWANIESPEKAALRPDIYSITDPKQLALMQSEGLTGYQAASRLLAVAQTPKDVRYYETLLTQTWTTETGKSAAYHAWAKDTGLPQLANPYEYTADLLTYAMKGYPTREAERFSPIDYTVLGLPGGKGQQEYAWGTTAYDVTKAMDVVAAAQRSGEMGPYGELKAWSSKYGELPIGQQQDIAKAAARTAGWDYRESIWSEPKGWSEATRTRVVEMPSQFASSKYDVVQKATPGYTSEYFTSVSKSIESTPGLGFFYGIGKTSVSREFVASVSDIFRTTPILSSVYKGGEAFAAKGEVATQQKKLADVGYYTRLEEYNRAIADYNKAAESYKSGGSSDAEVYSRLTEQYKSLQVTESKLKSMESPLVVSQKRYSELAGTLVDTRPIEQLSTYGFAKPLLDFGESYKKAITAPISSAMPIPLAGEAVSGFVGAPGMVVSTVGQALIGTERLSKNLQEFPALVSSGFALQVEAFATKPMETTASFVSTYALFAGASAAITRGGGVIRSYGKEYVPIEEIGYTPEVGFPLAPKGITTSQLKTSFEKSTLTPEPSRMSLQAEVPYVPKSTALPGEIASKVYGWTAWESTPLGFKPGKQYSLGIGSSELPGQYMAPVAESYFAKVGGQMPETIGLTLLPKSPTLIRTQLEGIKTIPGSLSRKVDYGQIEQFAKTEVPAGYAYLPMTKIEYEAVLQSGNIMEVVGSKYYTKVGGFGESRFLGTKIPISEIKVTGKMESLVGPAPTSVKSISYESYKPQALISGEGVVSATFSREYSRLTGTTYGSELKIVPESKPYYVSRQPSTVSEQSSSPLSTSKLSSSTKALSSSEYLRSSSYPYIKSVLMPYESSLSKPYVSEIPSLSSKASSVARPYSSLLSPPSSIISPPSIVYMPPSKITPLIPFGYYPLSENILGSFGGGKRMRPFTEIFRMGLDISSRQAARFGAPKGSMPTIAGLPGVAKNLMRLSKR